MDVDREAMDERAGRPGLPLRRRLAGYALAAAAAPLASAQPTLTADEPTGSDGHQVAVDLSSQSGEAGGHLAGMAEAGQTVQGADGADHVADLLAKIGAKSVGTTEDQVASAEQADIVTDRKATTPRTPAMLQDPVRNRGVAFSAEERAELGLTGRLPSAVLTLDEQAQRAYIQLRSAPAGIARKVYLEQLHDRNETLYFKVLSDHLAELLPIVADPMTGEAIGQSSQEYYSPDGIYLSIDRPGDIEKSFATLGLWGARTVPFP
jgi:Malic enzyme, N-terminal domain